MVEPSTPHREFRAAHRTDFADDDGTADPVLTAAVAAAHDDPARLPEVLAALHRCRVLAPVVALRGETEPTDDGGPDKEAPAEIAVPLLLDDGGARALPVFTSLAALSRWDPAARPVPVLGRSAAQVALSEGAEALVVDVAGPATVTLPGPELRALAEGRGEMPAWDDDELAAALTAVLETVPQARSAHLQPSAGHDARLTVVVTPGADRAVVARQLARAVTGLTAVRAGVRGLEVSVTTGSD